MMLTDLEIRTEHTHFAFSNMEAVGDLDQVVSEELWAEA